MNRSYMSISNANYIKNENDLQLIYIMSIFLNKNYLESDLCIVYFKKGVNFVSIFVYS